MKTKRITIIIKIIIIIRYTQDNVDLLSSSQSAKLLTLTANQCIFAVNLSLGCCHLLPPSAFRFGFTNTG